MADDKKNIPDTGKVDELPKPGKVEPVKANCGDPIGYANLNSSYWQSHFYAYGRLP